MTTVALVFSVLRLRILLVSASGLSDQRPTFLLYGTYPRIGTGEIT